MSKINERSPRSTRIKSILFIIAFLIVSITLIYTKNLVNNLQNRERETAQLYAKSIEFVANSITPSGDFNFIFNEIITKINFPMIETDSENKIIKSYRNIKIDSAKSQKQIEAQLLKITSDFDKINTPINVTFQDSIVLSKIHYGESELITELKFFPYVEIIIISLFILIAYLSFSFIKRNEQANIWVGMARETAHQLGTPISSMLGWMEVLSIKSNNNPEIEKLIFETQKDLTRLKKISDRFSKIGSKPELKKESLNSIIQNSIDYFNLRIPQFGKKIEIIFNPKTEFDVLINKDLFDWVLENLIKNSLDAIENGIGKITIEISESNKYLFIDLIDSGKGMHSSITKDIFRPGYSTKQRGWGLGLSLARRIVESYHDGKLFVKKSLPGVGTTFRIKLKKNNLSI